MELLLVVCKLSVAGSLMALPVLLLRPVVRRKLPSVSMSVLWGIVLVVFLIPMNLQSPVSVQKAVTTGDTSQVIQRVFSIDDSGTGNSAAATASTVSAGQKTENSVSHGLRTGVLLTVLWLSGVAVLAGNFAYRRLALYRRFRTAGLLESGPWQEYLCGIRRRVLVYTSDKLESAITYGVIRPKILLPTALLQADEKTLGHVLSHEAQHVRHFDALVNTGWLCLLCIHWFNPIVWLCRAYARKDKELLCDIRVIKKLGLTSRADYARTILDLTPVRESYSLASSFGSSSAQDRIIRIMTYRRSTVRTWCALVITLSVLLAVFAPCTLAASVKTFSPDYDDITGSYVLLEVSHNKTGYEYSLLGSYDTLEDILAKVKISAYQFSNFSYCIGNFFSSYLFSFQGVGFKYEDISYLLLNKSTFKTDKLYITKQEAFKLICDTGFG